VQELVLEVGTELSALLVDLQRRSAKIRFVSEDVVFGSVGQTHQKQGLHENKGKADSGDRA
jgi:hypothetical protein